MELTSKTFSLIKLSKAKVRCLKSFPNPRWIFFLYYGRPVIVAVLNDGYRSRVIQKIQQQRRVSGD